MLSTASLFGRLKNRLFLGSLCLPMLMHCDVPQAKAAEQVVPLTAWSEFDPFLQGIGKQTLTNNTGSGYTSTFAAGPVSSQQEMPRNYQQFTALDMSVVGQKITASFDVKFNEIPNDFGDTSFRFGFGDTLTNQGMVPLMVDFGEPLGSTRRMRYDSSITDEASSFAAGDYSGFLSASGTYGSGGGTPLGNNSNGGGLQDTTTTHSFTATMERVERNVDIFPIDGNTVVVNGFYTTITWTNDLAEAEVIFQDITDASYGGFDVDTGLGVWEEAVFAENGAIASIDTLGFVLFKEDPFSENGGANGGGYTISDFELVYDDGIEVLLSGDFNDDGTVDAADYTVWRDNLGGDAATLNGNGDGDGNVDSLDYDLWVANYGSSSSSATSAAVPEPSSLFIVLSTTFLGSIRSRRAANVTSPSC